MVDKQALERALRAKADQLAFAPRIAHLRTSTGQPFALVLDATSRRVLEEAQASGQLPKEEN